VTQVQLPVIRRQVLGDLLEARVRALPGTPVLTVFRGEAGDPPVKTHADESEDASRRVASYVVVFDGTGPMDIEAGLGRCGEQLRWTPQVTVAAGFTDDCIDAVDRVCAWLYGWSPIVPGVAAGPLEPPPGFDPGPPRPDRTVTPIRFFVPLLWRLDLTT
jgi:hypothetical protein